MQNVAECIHHIFSDLKYSTIKYVQRICIFFYYISSLAVLPIVFNL